MGATMGPLAVFLTIAWFGEFALGVSPIGNNIYLKPKYTEEGEFLLDYLKYKDVLEEEQELLPRKQQTVYKIITDNFNISQV